MRLGIDFGTTRTLVAAADRGNYPIVTFENLNGEFQEWFPSAVATRNGEWVFGFEAEALQPDRSWQIHHSFKRELAASSPKDRIFGAPVLELLTGYFATLKRDLLNRSNLLLEEPLEAVIGVPANANSNQRFLTVEAFKQAGFEVVGVLNEPSAAGIEYADRYRRDSSSRRHEILLVYDLGGGTFDCAVIDMTAEEHNVVTSAGIQNLGGADVDRMLLEMTGWNGIEESRALEACRLAKERLNPNTRKIVLHMDDAEYVVPVDEFYARSAPYVERTIDVVRATAAAVGGEEILSSIYLVGGASDFPVVLRMLRSAFGRKVRKSPYPHAATAIGLAIAADPARAAPAVMERFTRHFGVWREGNAGTTMVFDPVFPKGTPLPAHVTRSYCPVHNIGHFRYLECGEVDDTGRPGGDITLWDEIHFPFDPALQNTDVAIEPVRSSIDAGPQHIEEVYDCDANGIVEVTIQNQTSAYERRFRLRE